MIVVADSGPLHYLVLLEHIDLLRRFYGQVLVPDPSPVSSPRPAHPISCGSGWRRRRRGSMCVQSLLRPLTAITDDLDLGERAAIALAETDAADLLLIDEAAGRAEAKRRRLRVTGTLGVLRAGAEQGVVNVPDLIERLKNTTFYMDEALVNIGLRSVARALAGRRFSRRER